MIITPHSVQVLHVYRNPSFSVWKWCQWTAYFQILSCVAAAVRMVIVYFLICTTRVWNIKIAWRFWAIWYDPFLSPQQLLQFEGVPHPVTTILPPVTCLSWPLTRPALHHILVCTTANPVSWQPCDEVKFSFNFGHQQKSAFFSLITLRLSSRSNHIYYFTIWG